MLKKIIVCGSLIILTPSAYGMERASLPRVVDRLVPSFPDLGKENIERIVQGFSDTEYAQLESADPQQANKIFYNRAREEAISLALKPVGALTGAALTILVMWGFLHILHLTLALGNHIK